MNAGQHALTVKPREAQQLMAGDTPRPRLCWHRLAKRKQGCRSHRVQSAQSGKGATVVRDVTESVFVAWGGNQELARKVGNELDALQYGGIVGGGQPSDLFIGAQILSQIQCHVA